MLSTLAELCCSSGVIHQFSRCYDDDEQHVEDCWSVRLSIVLLSCGLLAHNGTRPEVNKILLTEARLVVTMSHCFIKTGVEAFGNQAALWWRPKAVCRGGRSWWMAVWSIVSRDSW